MNEADLPRRGLLARHRRLFVLLLLGGGIAATVADVFVVRAAPCDPIFGLPGGYAKASVSLNFAGALCLAGAASLAPRLHWAHRIVVVLVVLLVSFVVIFVIGDITWQNVCHRTPL